jgi:hypothetical protein
MAMHFQRKAVTAFTATKPGEVSVYPKELVTVSEYIPYPNGGWMLRNSTGKLGFAAGSIFVKTRCTKDGCTKVAKAGEFCNSHSGRKNTACTFHMCNRSTYHGLCSLHAICTFRGCQVAGQLRAGGLCRKHAVEFVCIQEGCKSVSRSNMRCKKHNNAHV